MGRLEDLVEEGRRLIRNAPTIRSGSEKLIEYQSISIAEYESWAKRCCGVLDELLGSDCAEHDSITKEPCVDNVPLAMKIIDELNKAIETQRQTNMSDN